MGPRAFVALAPTTSRALAHLRANVAWSLSCAVLCSPFWPSLLRSLIFGSAIGKLRRISMSVFIHKLNPFRMSHCMNKNLDGPRSQPAPLPAAPAAAKNLQARAGQSKNPSRPKSGAVEVHDALDANPSSWPAPRVNVPLANPKLTKPLPKPVIKPAARPQAPAFSSGQTAANRIVFDGLAKTYGGNIVPALEEVSPILRSWGEPNEVFSASHKLLWHVYANDRHLHETRPLKLAEYSKLYSSQFARARGQNPKTPSFPSLSEATAKIAMPDRVMTATPQEHVAVMRGVHELAKWVRDYGAIIKTEARRGGALHSTAYFHPTRAPGNDGKAWGILVITDAKKAGDRNGRLQTVYPARK